MKKLLLFAFTVIGVGCFSQNYDLKTITEVKFFGVDYSHVRIYEASETVEQFHYIFGRINDLFIEEPQKYEVASFLKKKVTEVSINEVMDRIKGMDLTNLITTDKRLRLTREVLQSAIIELKINPEYGVGVVFVADILNKVEGMGYYHIVFFNMEDSQIIDTWQDQGRSGGFGLRNFWASTVYKMIKSNRIRY